jgi:hypothetical protein
MRKIKFDKSPHCGHISRVSQPYHKMNRNQISRTASDIQAAAKMQSELASIAGSTQKETAWATIEGRAQRLANDACESQWTLKMLRRRLAELKVEVAA